MFIEARMELAAESRGPVFQCTEMAGDVSEFFVTEAQSSQGHVLMGWDEANG